MLSGHSSSSYSCGHILFPFSNIRTILLLFVCVNHILSPLLLGSSVFGFLSILLLVSTDSEGTFWPYSLSGFSVVVLDLLSIVLLCVLVGIYRPQSGTIPGYLIFGPALQGKGLKDVTLRGLSYLCRMDLTGAAVSERPKTSELEQGLLGAEAERASVAGPKSALNWEDLSKSRLLMEMFLGKALVRDSASTKGSWRESRAARNVKALVKAVRQAWINLNADPGY